MDRDLARIVATSGMRASRELGELVPFISEHFPECVELKLGIAAAVAEIGLKVVQPTLEADPALQREFEDRMRKLGRTT